MSWKILRVVQTRTFLWILGWMLVGAAALQSLEIRFISPTPETPVFDRVTVELEVAGGNQQTMVELTIDGTWIGEREGAPYRFEVDVGSENRSHRFEATAKGMDGAVAHQQLVTPAILVHESLELDLRQVYVTATRRNGKRVLNLEQEDFQLRDEDEVQEIVTFARGDIPFTATLLLDTSISMQGARLEAALRGAENFVREMEELDEARLMLFSNRLLAVSEFTNDSAELMTGLEGVQAEGGTALNDFLFLALRQLDQRQGRRVVILLSDGSDVHSVLDMDQVREAAKRSQAQLFWVKLEIGAKKRAFNSWRDPKMKEKQLRDLIQTVAESGGRRIRIQRIDQIDDAFQEILQELREQYALGYYPKRRHEDGRWRQIEAEIDRRGVEPRTREGYYDF